VNLGREKSGRSYPVWPCIGIRGIGCCRSIILKAGALLRSSHEIPRREAEGRKRNEILAGIEAG